MHLYLNYYIKIYFSSKRYRREGAFSPPHFPLLGTGRRDITQKIRRTNKRQENIEIGN